MSTIDPTAPATRAPEGLTLTAPDPVTAVAPAQVAAAVPIPAPEKAKLDAQIADFVEQVTSLDIHADGFKSRVDAVVKLGDADVQAAAAVSNRLLDRPVNAMKDGLFDPASPISKGLLDLRQTVEKLDPSKQGDLFAPRKWLGLIPAGSKLVAYFDGYRSSQSHLNAIVQSLYHGKDELERDNVAIEQEKGRMWTLMQRLEQYVYLGKQIDASLTAKIAGIETADPARAKVLKEDVLFYTRQKVQDLLTQTAVNVQGYLALDLIKKNNVELIKGVERATTTTISALRTAVIVAQALANEKLVLDQITALNTTTGNIIESTSQMLKTQTDKVYAQAAGSTIDIKQLQRAFDNVYATMDAVADYKVKALDSMSQTVDALTTEVAKAKTYLDKTRASTATDALTHLDPAAAGDASVRLLPGT